VKRIFPLLFKDLPQDSQCPATVKEKVDGAFARDDEQLSVQDLGSRCLALSLVVPPGLPVRSKSKITYFRNCLSCGSSSGLRSHRGVAATC
jgi:hypothetical protein